MESLRNVALVMACCSAAVGCGLDVDGEPAPSCFTDPQRCDTSMDAGALPPARAATAASPASPVSFPSPRDAGQALPEAGPLRDGAVTDDGGLAPSGCPPGQLACRDRCVNIDDDPANCGGCGLACRDSQTCRFGQCCDFDDELCDGVCTDTQSDPRNCGSCGFVCELGSDCQLGLCSPEDGFDPR